MLILACSSSKMISTVQKQKQQKWIDIATLVLGLEGTFSFSEEGQQRLRVGSPSPKSPWEPQPMHADVVGHLNYVEI